MKATRELTPGEIEALERHGRGSLVLSPYSKGLRDLGLLDDDYHITPRGKAAASAGEVDLEGSATENDERE